MTIRDEAERRYRDDVDAETGEPVDDWGYSECARRAFEAGAEYAKTGIAAELRRQRFIGTKPLHDRTPNEAAFDDALTFTASLAESWQPAGGPESTSGDVDRETHECESEACDPWFDRTICGCGVMHTVCSATGRALDGCPEEADS